MSRPIAYPFGYPLALSWRVTSSLVTVPFIEITTGTFLASAEGSS
jgi:hypothetical protein